MKYDCFVLPIVLMPRGDFCPLGQVISHTSGGGFLYDEERSSSFPERTSRVGPSADFLSLVFGCRVVLRSVQFGSEDVSSAQVAQERTTVTQEERGESRTGRHFQMPVG